MKRQVLTKALIVIMLLMNVSRNVRAGDILFETNFLPEEGWVDKGSVSSADANAQTVWEQKIMYKGKAFWFYYKQGWVRPAEISTEDCSPGYMTLNKNNVGVGSALPANPMTTAYFELPVFDKDVSISFHYSSSEKEDRRWVVEQSSDGRTFQFDPTMDLAPMRVHGAGGKEYCNHFFCPTRIPAGNTVRLVVQSSNGQIKLYSLKIEEYVPDVTPPVLVSSVPGKDNTDVSPTIREIKLNFSEPVKEGIANILLLDSRDLVLEYTPGQLKYNSDVVTFPIPEGFRLKLGETYDLFFEKGSIRDLSNNQLAETLVTFKTKITGSPEKNITSFKIPNQVGEEVINVAAGTIAVTANHDVNLLMITPTIEISPFATIVNDAKDFSAGSATYVVTAEDGTTKEWKVTITKNELKQASLPVIFKGKSDNPTAWKYIVDPGWSKYIPNNDSKTTVGNGGDGSMVYYCCDINNRVENNTGAPIFMQNWFTPGANRVSFLIRYGNVTSNYDIIVEESANGEEWTDVVSFKPSNLEFNDEGVLVSPTGIIPDPAPPIPCTGDMLGMRSYPVKTTSQYLRWAFRLRSSSGYYFDDVVIENVTDNTPPALSGNQPVSYANYSNSSKAQIALQFSEAVKASEALIKRTTSIKINDTDYYEATMLCQRNGSVVFTNLPALVQGASCKIEIPANALVDLSNNPFAGGIIQFTVDFGTGITLPAVNKAFVYVQDGWIKIGEETPVVRIDLFNTVGVLTKIATNVQQLSTDGLKGIYIVRYTLSGGQTKIAKVIL